MKVECNKQYLCFCILYPECAIQLGQIRILRCACVVNCLRNYMQYIYTDIVLCISRYVFIYMLSLASRCLFLFKCNFNTKCVSIQMLNTKGMEFIKSLVCDLKQYENQKLSRQLEQSNIRIDPKSFVSSFLFGYTYKIYVFDEIFRRNRKS